MTGSTRDAFEVLARKELLLSELRTWLKMKGLWEQAMNDLGWRVS